jgi:thymidylate synthase (FAD)
LTQLEVHNARLISITPDAEKQIVYMARVSNPSNQDNMDTAPRLIKYLLKHKHWSPFEMATMQVEINTTRAIETQILRHRSFSYQSFSQRYSDVSQLPAIGLPHLRSQDLKNKQASHDDLPPELIKRYNRYIQEIYDGAQDLYHNMLEHGVAKECARSILPLGTPTRIYQSGTIRSWIHYLEVRAGIETQLEHRMIAEAIKEIFKEQLPNVFEAVFS